MAENNAVGLLAEDVARARINDDVKDLARAILVQSTNESDQLVLELSEDASPWYGRVDRDQNDNFHIRRPFRAGDSSKGVQPNTVQAVVQTAHDISFTLKHKDPSKSSERYLFMYRPDRHGLYFTDESSDVVEFETVTPEQNPQLRLCPPKGTLKLNPDTYLFRTQYGSDVILRSFPNARCSPLEPHPELDDNSVVAEEGQAFPIVHHCVDRGNTVITSGPAPSEPGSRKRRKQEQQAPSQKDGQVQRRKLGAHDDVASTVASGEYLVNFDKDQQIEVHGTPLDPGYTLTAMKKLFDSSKTNAVVVKHSLHAHLLTLKVCKWNNERTPSNYKRERSIHEGLSHKQIVHFDHADDRFFALFLEYVQGPDLGRACFLDVEWMCVMPPDMISWILESTCQGLEYLRTQGITHGDIKLGNILFLPIRGALIADFGLSIRDVEGAKFRVGTPMYMGYENIMPEYLGPYRDTFALGVCMLYLLGLIKKPCRPRFDDNGRRLADAWRPRDFVQGKQTSIDALTAWLTEIDDIVRPLMHIHAQDPVSWLRSYPQDETPLAGLSRRAAKLPHEECLHVVKMLQHVRHMFYKNPDQRITPAKIAMLMQGPDSGRPSKKRADQWAKFIAGEKKGVAWEHMTLEEYDPQDTEADPETRGLDIEVREASIKPAAHRSEPEDTHVHSDETQLDPDRQEAVTKPAT